MAPTVTEVTSDDERNMDLEFDDGVAVPKLPPAGDTSEPSDADYDKISELKQEAAEAEEAGDLSKAVDKLSEVVMLSKATLSAMTLCKRAALTMKLKRPNAVIKDCTRALEINNDSAKAHKLRGRAYKMKEQWKEAAADLNEGLRIDPGEGDDEILQLQKEVNEKWLEIAKEERAVEIEKEKFEEEAKRARIERIKREREEARIRAEKEQKDREEAGDDGMGGMPGGMDPSAIFAKLLDPVLSDPEILELMKNPKVKEAVDQVKANPSLMFDPSQLKHQDDPVVANAMKVVMQKMTAGLMGGMGMGGGMPGGGMGGKGGGMAGMGGGGGTGGAGGSGVEELD
eukprot:GHVN01067656.1.p1 GENE.GHVN01067656.1~~GHVN01067656.1.p1  ORF type:complete len:342 (+),score=110.68 GHVN01067656.1:81-1106(+)